MIWLHSDYILTTFWLHSDYTLTSKKTEKTKKTKKTKKGMVGHHNFWSIFLDDLWSKKIYRPNMIVDVRCYIYLRRSCYHQPANWVQLIHFAIYEQLWPKRAKEQESMRIIRCVKIGQNLKKRCFHHTYVYKYPHL